ncbi:hypothetical protein Q9Q99_16670 [Curtobacterium flaccumfaciens]|nr:hypothetical protein Q9Q99_16670 [Curtobacterium flaccumfaciens]
MVSLDPTDPLILSLSLVSLVVLLPGILLAVKIARIGPAGILSSTRFRVRWAWTAWCLLPTLVIAAAMFVLQTGLFWDGGMITTNGGSRLEPRRHRAVDGLASAPSP